MPCEILAPIYPQGNWGTERFDNSTEVMQLVNDWAGFQTQVKSDFNARILDHSSKLTEHLRHCAGCVYVGEGGNNEDQGNSWNFLSTTITFES